MSGINSPKICNTVAAIVFIVGIGVLSYMGVYDWMPALALVTGIALLVRQALNMHHLDVIVTVLVFGALFFSSFMQFFARVFFPTFLMIGAVYYILRQFFEFKSKGDAPPADPPAAAE